MAKRKKSVLLRVAIFAFCVYMVCSLFSLQSLYIKKLKEKNAGLDQMDTLQYEVEELENLLKNGNDTELIEKAARERLGYSYPNEQIYQDSTRY